MRRPMIQAVFLSLAVTSLFATTAQAAYTIEPEVGVLQGFTQYQLITTATSSGGDWVLSQLNFSLDNPVLGARFTSTTDSGLIVQAKVLTKVTSPAGAFKDSDWIPNDGQDGLDIYSKSSLNLIRALILNGNLVFPARDVGSIAVSPKVGWRRQQFDFSAHDLDQVGYGSYATSYTDSVSGTVLSYSVTYNLPYVGLNASLPAGNLPLSVDVTFSPWVFAHDVDDHLLRYKLSTGDSTGSAWSIGAHTVYTFREGLELTEYVDYSFIHTSGTQTQYYYADSDAPAGTTYVVDQALTSEQCEVGLRVTARF